MAQVVADVLVLERPQNWFFGTFAALAVWLAIAGLYGLISHEAELSIRDIGVLMAMGATKIVVLMAIYRRVSLILSGGVLTGLLLAEATRKLIAANVSIQTAKDLAVIVGLEAALHHRNVGCSSTRPPRRLGRSHGCIAL